MDGGKTHFNLATLQGIKSILKTYYGLLDEGFILNITKFKKKKKNFDNFRGREIDFRGDQYLSMIHYLQPLSL